MSFHVPEQYRQTDGVRFGKYATKPNAGNHGCFIFPNGLRTIAFAGDGWEHVSVSYRDRCPSWDEMCFVKDHFWDAEDCVVQFHPPKSRYVNCHPFTLHLWKRIDRTVHLPPSYMV